MRVLSRFAPPIALMAVIFILSAQPDQTFVEGRHGSPVDVLIDATGIAIAILLHARYRTRVRE
jgi:VanZ family protein